MAYEINDFNLVSMAQMLLAYLFEVGDGRDRFGGLPGDIKLGAYTLSRAKIQVKAGCKKRDTSVSYS
jgi:hypothetical protein